MTSGYYEQVLNDAGTCEFVIPVRDLSAASSSGFWPVTPNSLRAGKTILGVERNGGLVWSGLLETTSLDPTVLTATLDGQGWFNYFGSRIFPSITAVTAPGTDQVVLASRIVSSALDATSDGGSIAAALPPITVEDPLPSGVNFSGDYATTDFMMVADAVNDLAGVAGGFDFDFVSSWQLADNIYSVSAEFVTTYPAGGRQTNVVFDLQAPGITLTSFTEDATNVVNNVVVTGSNSSTTTGPDPNATVAELVGDSDTVVTNQSLSTADLLASGYPVLEMVQAYSDTSNAAVLNNRATAILAANQTAAVLPAFSIRVTGNPAPEDYAIGDIVRCVGTVLWYDIDTSYRITTRRVNVDNSGNEMIDVTLSMLGEIPNS
jgi:hypothetical protein